jgi:FtsH-binding integral membrane protein
MNDYDRDFRRGYGAEAVTQTREEGALLLTRVSFLTLGMLICTAMGAGIFWAIQSPVILLPAVILTFVMIFVCRAVARNYPVNLLALAVFAGLEGIVISPALMYYAHVQGPMIVIQAALLASVIFGIVGLLGYTSTRSFAGWLPALMVGLIVLLIAGLVLMFINSAMGSWLYAAAGTVLFTAITFVDFTRIRHDYSADDYAMATIQIYLDLINLFLFILRLLGGGRRD